MGSFADRRLFSILDPRAERRLTTQKQPKENAAARGRFQVSLILESTKKKSEMRTWTPAKLFRLARFIPQRGYQARCWHDAE